MRGAHSYKVITLERRDYTFADVCALADWLNERAAGYPKRDLPWPSEIYVTASWAAYHGPSETPADRPALPSTQSPTAEVSS